MRQIKTDVKNVITRTLASGSLRGVLIVYDKPEDQPLGLGGDTPRQLGGRTPRKDMEAPPTVSESGMV